MTRLPLAFILPTLLFRNNDVSAFFKTLSDRKIRMNISMKFLPCDQQCSEYQKDKFRKFQAFVFQIVWYFAKL